MRLSLANGLGLTSQSGGGGGIPLVGTFFDGQSNYLSSTVDTETDFGSTIEAWSVFASFVVPELSDTPAIAETLLGDWRMRLQTSEDLRVESCYNVPSTSGGAARLSDVTSLSPGQKVNLIFQTTRGPQSLTPVIIVQIDDGVPFVDYEKSLPVAYLSGLAYQFFIGKSEAIGDFFPGTMHQFDLRLAGSGDAASILETSLPDQNAITSFMRKFCDSDGNRISSAAADADYGTPFYAFRTPEHFYSGVHAGTGSAFSTFGLWEQEPSPVNVDSFGSFDTYPVSVNDDLSAPTLSLSGSYIGDAPVTLEARIVQAGDLSEVQTWGSVSLFSASGGNWTGTFTMSSAGTGEYYVQVRKDTVSNPGTQSLSFITAGLLGNYGQSNSNFFRATADAAITPASGAYTYDGSMNSAPSGSGMVATLNELIAATGFSWVGVTSARGGTALEFLTPSNDVYGVYSAFSGYFSELGNQRALAHIFVHGEQNAVNILAVDPDGTAYKANFDDIYDTLAAQTTSGPAGRAPVFITGLGTADVAADQDPHWTRMREILREIPDERAWAHWGAEGVDSTRRDDYHFLGSSYTERGRRLARSILAELGEVTAFNPFKVTSASVIDSTTTRVTVDHGEGTAMSIREIVYNQEADGANTTVGRGFRIASGGPAVAATAAIVNGTTFDLTHAALADGNRKIDIWPEAAPDISGVIMDNATQSVPLLGAYQFGVTDGAGVPTTLRGSTSGSDFASGTPISHTFATGGLTVSRSVYMVVANTGDALTATVNGVAPTNTLYDSVQSGDRVLVFETDQTGALSITRSGGTGVEYVVFCVHAEGTTGAFSLSDTFIDTTGVATATNTGVTIPRNDVVVGFAVIDGRIYDKSTYVDADFTQETVITGVTRAVDALVSSGLGTGRSETFTVTGVTTRALVASFIVTAASA